MNSTRSERALSLAFARVYSGIAIVCLFVAIALAPRAFADEKIRVGAAISLSEALDEIAKTYNASSGDVVELTYGSSGQVAAKVKSGADIDVFISAANKQVDELAAAGLVDVATRRTTAFNALVLVVPPGATSPLRFESLGDEGVTRIAAGEPQTVPAGQYAAQVFKSLKLDERIKSRLVYGTNVRQVLSYVERGEVSAGIVYATDARESGDKVKIVAMADPATHDPIVYPAVIVSASKKRAAATRLLDYLAGEEARRILAGKGFLLPESHAVGATAPTSRSVAPPATAAAPASGAPSTRAISWYERGIWPALWLSMRIAICATLLAAIVAVPLASLAVRRGSRHNESTRPRKRTRWSLFEAAILLPLVLPPTVVGYVMIILLGKHGLLGQWFGGYSPLFRFEGAVLAAAIVALPMLYLPAKAAFAAVDRELQDVAVLFGATRFQSFRYVSVPLARRGLAAGLVLAFARALGEFGATAMVFGFQPTRLTLPISIYSDFEQGKLGNATGAVVALSLIAFGLVALSNVLGSPLAALRFAVRTPATENSRT